MIRVSGGDALSLASEFMTPPLRDAAPRTATKVRVFDADGPIDEGVAVFYPAASSPTGEDLVELTLHGSPYILQRTLFRALKRARLASPGEFSQRAFLAGKMDLAQAEAVAALIRARTETAHRAALRQLSGGLSDAVRSSRMTLLDLLVRVEACLDHPEEDIPSLTPAQASAEFAAARAPIARLADTFALGRLAGEGPRLALVGRPNAGKSSLLNALLGRERAIVCAEPGTTRDTLEEPAELAGMPAVLVDTAGLREDCADPAEREGIARAEAALETCDAAVLVIDAARAPSEEDARLHARIVEAARRRGTPLVAALNKADLGRAWDGAALPQSVFVSARLGTGLEELRSRLAESLGAGGDREPLVVTSARHAQALRQAAEELTMAQDAVARHGSRWEDRAACNLREARRQLGLILGEGAPDETLHAVFSRFCVGK
jgi:tRNA modification GTPase